MTIRHMQIFLTVCECKNNVTRAAEKLYIAQPTVTVAIQEIEKYYGILLFDRISRRLYLTEAGKQFREYALRIVSLFQDMERGLKNWDSFGVLRIGASITIGSQFLPSYVEAYSFQHPGADVRVQIGPSYQQAEALLNNTLDMALLESPVRDENLAGEAYMEDSLAVICSAQASFRSGQTISREEFSKQRFLLREHGSGTREVFDQAMQKAGISVQPVWEGMSTTALVNAAVRGLGIAVVPRRMISGPLEKGLITMIQVEGISFERRFYIVRHRDKLLTSLQQDFIRLCKNYELDYPIPKYEGLF